MNESHRPKPRVSIPDLKLELAARLRKVDRNLIALLARRAQLAMQVQERKHFDGDQPIIRQVVEEQRLEDIRTWAKERGVNPSFAASLLYFIIAESCRVQINHLQAEKVEMDALEELRTVDKEGFYQALRQNLLNLAATVAPTYDYVYGEGANFATSSYIRFENQIIAQEVATLRGIKNTESALDLGCATGRVALMLSEHFRQVSGYDISHDMIEQATKKSRGPNVQFSVADLEDGIPAKDGSASFVVMNLGTASDLRELRRIVASTMRVLRKDGRFVFSFYNAGALLYQWLLPWPSGLAAEMNLDINCLAVRLREKTFRIHARPYSLTDARNIFKDSGLIMGSITTYPTMSPILPNEFFDEGIPSSPAEKDRIGETTKTADLIDRKLADLGMGAYVIVTGRRP